MRHDDRKLQVNLHGSWRDVVGFDAMRADEVEAAAAHLARAHGALRLRITGPGTDVRYSGKDGLFKPLHAEGDHAQ